MQTAEDLLTELPDEDYGQNPHPNGLWFLSQDTYSDATA